MLCSFLDQCIAISSLQEDFVTSTERVYEFEYINNNFLVKKIFAHEKLSYMPWLHRSFGVQYIETRWVIDLLLYSYIINDD